MTANTLLTIDGLTITVAGSGARIVDGICLNVHGEQVVALVGGSGGGKTMTGLSVLGLLPAGIEVERGTILFNGENLLQAGERRMARIRGKDISMVFQEPLSAFNPVFTVGYQIEEVLQYHTSLRRNQRRERMVQLLDMVGSPEPRRIAQSYPHQLSGGLRQRAMIAQAIAAGPKLVIADEPTSNLDVTLQVRIIELFRKLKNELRLSFLLITHDLGVVKQLADKVAILCGGKIVEDRPAREILAEPHHPFTQELLASIEGA